MFLKSWHAIFNTMSIRQKLIKIKTTLSDDNQ